MSDTLSDNGQIEIPLQSQLEQQKKREDSFHEAGTQQAAAQQAPAAQNSDSESDEVGASETREMRCHCGMDHGDGDTVECEQCKTWQHLACMGLTTKSNTDDYLCEICRPRKLPVSKSEARKAQKKILEKLIRATEKEKEREKKNKRKSEPPELMKKQQPVQQPPSSRKSAPAPIQPPMSPPQSAAGAHRRVPQLNEYSKLAATLLNSMPQTAGADTLLEESRRHKKAKHMYVEGNVVALVTTAFVQIRQVILEVNGFVTMAGEIKRQPGGGNMVFMYDGLMKGTAGEEMGNGQELVCIDTKRKGNDTKHTRRSCVPNCVLKHVLGSQATLGIMLVAMKDILKNTEVTLPFDADWKNSDVSLECAEHVKELHFCPFESERKRYAQERNRVKDTEKKRIEEARRAEEERRSDIDDEEDEDDGEESDSEMRDEGEESDEIMEKEKGSSKKSIRKTGRMLRKRIPCNNHSISDDEGSDGDEKRRDEKSYVSNTKQTKRMRKNGKENPNSIDPIQEETIDDTIKIENDLESMDFDIPTGNSGRIDDDYDISDYQESVQNGQESSHEIDIDYRNNRYPDDNRRSIRNRSAAELASEIPLEPPKPGVQINSDTKESILIPIPTDTSENNLVPKSEEIDDSQGKNGIKDGNNLVPKPEKVDNSQENNKLITPKSKSTEQKSDGNQIDEEKPNIDELVLEDTENSEPISPKIFLKSLNKLISEDLNFPSLQKFHKKIEKAAEKMDENKTMTLADFSVCLETILLILTKSKVDLEYSEKKESASLLDVIQFIQVSLAFSKVLKFHSKLNKLIRELAIKDKRISAEKVQAAVETALHIFSNFI